MRICASMRTCMPGTAHPCLSQSPASGRSLPARAHALQALANSTLAREDVFLTTKIHPRHLGYQATLDALEASLGAFQTDFVDLVLLHYPECWPALCREAPAGTWQESWRALEELLRRGKALAIGAWPPAPALRG